MFETCESDFSDNLSVWHLDIDNQVINKLIKNNKMADQLLLINWLLKNQLDGPVCGSDGRTYPSACSLK